MPIHAKLVTLTRPWGALLVVISVVAFGCLGCSDDSLDNRLDAYRGHAAVPCSPTAPRDHGLEAQIRAAGLVDSAATWGYVLERGEEAIFSRAWLTQHSLHTIDIQYFIFSMDNVGLIALDYLIQAADRGIKVRMLVDDIMLDVGLEDVAALNAHPNISIRIYNPTDGKNFVQKASNIVSDFQGFNQRMHNKTFIVDGRVAITGGRNIADEYFDYDQSYNFRDRDVLLIGQGAAAVQSSFDTFWEDPLAVEWAGETPPAETTASLYASIHSYACDPANFWPEIRELIDGVPNAIPAIIEAGALHRLDDMRFVSDAPGKNDDGGFHGGGLSTAALTELVKQAAISLTIQSPYLIVTEEGLDLFADAVSRGVDVSILTNSLCSTDNLEAFNGYQRIREDLLAAGVEIYEYRPDAAIRRELITAEKQAQMDYLPIFGLHAKSMVIDHETVVIGTFNMDPRSANLNTECAAIMKSPAMAAQVEALMLEELAPENAWHTTSDWNPDAEAGSWKEFNCWLRGIVPASVL
ncbi:MAG: phospholipase D family protein [Bacteroidetes bacterium]|nr:phospholipase D family protein [Bacteroidota bacterium]MDA1335380.1 phospholipase D family protein [Bacteroidota bacterium]